MVDDDTFTPMSGLLASELMKLVTVHQENFKKVASLQCLMTPASVTEQFADVFLRYSRNAPWNCSSLYR